MGFKERVWREARRVPTGRVTTYRAIARRLGAKGAARAVGNALNASPGRPTVPCHRVVKSDGLVGGFAWGTARKIALLQSEGVAVTRGRIDLKRFGV